MSDDAAEVEEAYHVGKYAGTRYRPTDQSFFRRLVCWLDGHTWDKHPFKDEDGEHEAVTCRVCGEMRVIR